MKSVSNSSLWFLFAMFCLLSAGATDGSPAGPEEPSKPAAGEDAFQLATPFQDNAVLQRNQKVPIWGKSIPDDQVTVEFSGQEKSTAADSNGRWRLELDPMPPNTTAEILVASSAKTGKTLQIRNIVVGDVWLCSGQSNMVWSLMDSSTGAAEMASADYPLIRGFRVESLVSEQPADSIRGGNWVVAQSKTDNPAESPIRHFSGVAYHFAKALFEETGIPVGFIQSAYGGTIIEAWMAQDSVAASPFFPQIQERWEKLLGSMPERIANYEKSLEEYEKTLAAGEKPKGPRPRNPRGLETERHRPASLYNGMIAPMAPYALAGFLWYQGEADTGRPQEYEDLFPRLLRQFRKDFGDHPFYFVQLPNFSTHKNNPSGRQWAIFRETQAKLLEQDRTSMAVTIDVGDAMDIHPRNKADVGRRLALLALRDLGKSSIVSSGPVFEMAVPEGRLMRVKFKGAPELDLRTGEASALSFEVAGAEGEFFPAVAVLDGNDLLVGSDKVPTPTAIRYAWFNNPSAILFCKNGLPAAPFRSDDFAVQKSTSRKVGTP